MEDLNNYTVVELIEKYKTYFYDVIDILLKDYFNSKQVSEIKRDIRDDLKRNGIAMFSAQYAKMEKEELYNRLVDSIKFTDKINNGNAEKQNILAILYKECASKMNKDEIKELRNLLFGKDEYLKLTRKKNGVAYDYDVLFRKQPERLDKISDKTIKKIFEIAIEIAGTEDISSMITSKTRDPQLYDIIINKLVVDFFVKEKGIPIEEYNKMIDDTQKCNELDSLYGEEFSNRYKEYFENNMQLFNRTDLLLNTAARIILGLRKHKGEDIAEINAHFFDGEYDGDETDKTDYSVIILRQISEELEKTKYEDIDFVIMSSQVKGKEIIRVNKNVIKEFLDRCTETEYISDKDIKNIKTDLLKGDFPENKDILRIANFETSNLIDVCKNFEAREKSDPLKQKTLECAIKMIYHLLDQGNLTEEKLIDLYVNSLIPFDIINEINFEELENGLIDKKFKAVYDELLYSNEKDKKENELINNKLSKFTELYKKLEKEGLADTNELLEMLFNAYGRDNKVEILSDLNGLGIITLEKCIEEAGIYFLISKYREGVFTPAKMRELYENSYISIDEIATFIKDIPENEKKYLAIGAIFPGENEEDKDDRDLLVAECIVVNNGVNLKTDTKRNKIIPRIKSDEFITDPFARLNLFKELDRDYELKMTDDGHVVIKCPNSKKVIIEKMLDNKGNPYYGAATYVLDENYYKRNEINIYEAGSIVRQELVRDAKLKGVSKIIHQKDKWGEDLKKEFGLKVEGKYTEEEITRINEAIGRVERSRTKI